MFSDSFAPMRKISTLLLIYEPIFLSRFDLKERISFEIWERLEDKTIIRFVTHYNLSYEDLNNIVKIIKEASYDL